MYDDERDAQKDEIVDLDGETDEIAVGGSGAEDQEKTRHRISSSMYPVPGKPDNEGRQYDLRSHRDDKKNQDRYAAPDSEMQDKRPAAGPGKGDPKAGRCQSQKTQERPKIPGLQVRYEPPALQRVVDAVIRRGPEILPFALAHPLRMEQTLRLRRTSFGSSTACDRDAVYRTMGVDLTGLDVPKNDPLHLSDPVVRLEYGHSIGKQGALDLAARQLGQPVF